MAYTESQIGYQLGYLGLLVTYWNELETRVRSILMLLSADPLTAAMLAADFQVSPLLNATRLMAKERRWMTERINAKLRKTKKKNRKLYEPFYEHVEHFLDSIDILREYRNYYVHNALCVSRKPTLQIHKITARGRVSFTAYNIRNDDLTNLIQTITEFLIYSDRLLQALEKNESRNFSERPTWPRKPPAPSKLRMPDRITLQDAVPQLRASPTLFQTRMLRQLRAVSKDRMSEKS